MENEPAAAVMKPEDGSAEGADDDNVGQTQGFAQKTKPD